MTFFVYYANCFFFFFFFNDTATTEIYTLSLHDALPIFDPGQPLPRRGDRRREGDPGRRSEEHTSELQSRRDLVCRLLLEKKQEDLRRPLGVLVHLRGVHRSLRSARH